MNRSVIAAFTASLLMWLAAGCDTGGNHYAGFTDLPLKGWSFGDTIRFTPQLDDSVAAGRLLVDVRHDNAYIYSNLWVEVTVDGPEGEAPVVDTVDLRLCDPYGRWLGSGFGATRQVADTLSRVRALYSGRTVKLRHLMRADTVRHIQQLGITFVPDNVGGSHRRQSRPGSPE